LIVAAVTCDSASCNKWQVAKDQLCLCALSIRRGR